MLMNYPVTAEDIKNPAKCFGPDIHNLKGETTKGKKL